MGKTHKATVVVAPREGGHDGWFHAGRRWGAGQHEDVELTDEEVQGLARRPGVVVIIGGKAVKPTTGEPRGSGTPATLSSDEVAALEKYRAERAKAAAAHEEATGSTAPLEYQNKGEAVRTALATGSGGTPGVFADTPLQDAAILQGAPPPVSETSSPKPIDEKLTSSKHTHPKR